MENSRAARDCTMELSPLMEEVLFKKFKKRIFGALIQLAT